MKIILGKRDGVTKSKLQNPKSIASQKTRLNCKLQNSHSFLGKPNS
jgi:hypothetical protein